LFRDLPWQAAAILLTGAFLGLAWAIPRGWLRVLLGAGAAGLAISALVPRSVWFHSHAAAELAGWLALHAALAAWAGAMWFQDQGRLRPPEASLLESVAAGWVLLLLALLAAYAGMTFLAGGVIGGPFRASGGHSGPSGFTIQAGSVAAAAAGLAVLAHAWPSLRSPRAGLAATVLVALAWFMPALGGALFVVACGAATQRWRLAAAAVVAAAWIVGAFYYQLAWSLALKAGVLLAAAAVLGVLALAGRWSPTARAAAGGASRGLASAWIVAAGVLTLAAVNHAIWQKETVIAQGERVLVRLAPADPRSLMQGDFMRLQFRLPGMGSGAGTSVLATGLRRPFVVARREPSGVVHLLRVAHGAEALAPGEMRIELTPRNGDWTLVSDAWYFKEGEATRWEAARYGEFRVDATGRALLVGLADEQLQPIKP
jgi:uncharacterized membrane-anchored protein